MKRGRDDERRALADASGGRATRWPIRASAKAGRREVGGHLPAGDRRIDLGHDRALATPAPSSPVRELDRRRRPSAARASASGTSIRSTVGPAVTVAIDWPGIDDRAGRDVGAAAPGRRRGPGWRLRRRAPRWPPRCARAAPSAPAGRAACGLHLVEPRLGVDAVVVEVARAGQLGLGADVLRRGRGDLGVVGLGLEPDPRIGDHGRSPGRGARRRPALTLSRTSVPPIRARASAWSRW